MLEIRTGTFDADNNRLSGYAAVYNAPSKPLLVRGLNNNKPFVERIKPGAFAESMASNVQLLVGHDSRELLANTASGLLTLESDNHGLAFTVNLPDTQRARDVRTLVEARVLTAMSFGFYVKRDSWNGSERLLESVDLREVSIVADPAYEQTAVEARDSNSAIARLRLLLRSV